MLLPQKIWLLMWKVSVSMSESLDRHRFFTQEQFARETFANYLNNHGFTSVRMLWVDVNGRWTEVD